MNRWKMTRLALVGALAWSGRAAVAGGARRIPADSVAVVGGQVIGRAQLDELAREQLARIRSEEYEIKRRVLDQQVEKLLFAQEAAARKTTVEELTRTEVDGKAKPVTDEEVRAFYDGARDRMKDVPEAQALQQVRDNLQRQRARERRAALVSELKARRGVTVLLEPPRLAVEADGASKGPKDAPVTIVEFSDFQCPYCSRVVPTLKQIEERYGDKVRVVFRDFPLPFHKDAPRAAEAAACADEQGRFWDMHDRLFANQQGLQDADLKRYAAEIGLKTEEFGQCLDSGRQSARWQRHRDAGRQYGVNGTPAFFVNGRPLSGAQPFEAFAQLIDDELQRAQAATGSSSGRRAGAAPSPASRP